jgi:ring-1,2-phenylacetyl-CoA epoxidase subunit PaaC
MSVLQTSIEPSRAPDVRYVLRLADTCLILAQRLGEWCGHAPVLEEDIALTNIALDLIGQARALLTHAAQLGTKQPGGAAFDEDQLAFLREERDYLNPTLVELPRGDFAFTTLRNAMVATWLHLMWQRLGDSSDAELAGIAAKALKEARYHLRHSADWVVRLGDGTAESHQRIDEALQELWPYTSELFESDAVDEHAAVSGLGPRWSQLREPWLEQMRTLMAEAGLSIPAEVPFRSTGRSGTHSEHLGFLLSDMQYLQRAYPGGAW